MSEITSCSRLAAALALVGALHLVGAAAIGVGIVVGAVAGAITGGVIGGIGNVIQGKSFSAGFWQGAIQGALAGAMAGGFAGAAAGEQTAANNAASASKDPVTATGENAPKDGIVSEPTEGQVPQAATDPVPKSTVDSMKNIASFKMTLSDTIVGVPVDSLEPVKSAGCNAFRQGANAPTRGGWPAAFAIGTLEDLLCE